MPPLLVDGRHRREIDIQEREAGLDERAGGRFGIFRAHERVRQRGDRGELSFAFERWLRPGLLRRLRGSLLVVPIGIRQESRQSRVGGHPGRRTDPHHRAQRVVVRCLRRLAVLPVSR